MKNTGFVVALVLLLGACDAIDRCLDSGGAWDKEKEICQYEEP